MSEATPTPGATTIAIVGGTGALGSGLARRLVGAGYTVVLGSRDAERGAEAARQLSSEIGGAVQGMSNEAAAAAGDIVFVTVPFASQATTMAAIAASVSGKIVVDTTVPLKPPKVARVQLPSEGSAAAIAKAALPDDCRLVTGMHSVSAQKLSSGEQIPGHVMVFGDEVAARDAVIALLGAIGMAGLHAGPLDNAVAAEALTSVLISINKRYKVSEGAGIRITGVADTA